MRTFFPLLLIIATFIGSAAQNRVEITLDARAEANDAGRGIYNNAKDAFAAIDGCQYATLRVEPGVYWLDDPDDPAIAYPEKGRSVPFGIEVACDTLFIVGRDQDAEATVFAVNRGQTQGAIGNFTMMHFAGNVLKMENMTFGNYCNVDLVYPRQPELGRPKRNSSIVQAQIGICEPKGFSGRWSKYGSGTQLVEAVNCRFISRLNLCPFIGARYTYYDRCYFECTDDALTGTALYRDCKFTFFSSKPFYSTAPTGAIFINCDITMLTPGVQYLTKVPGMVTLIDTRFHSQPGDGKQDVRWTRDLSPVVSYQRNVSLDGKKFAVDADRSQLWQELPENVTPGTLLSLFEGDIRLKAEGDTAILAPRLIKWGGEEADMTPEIVNWQFPDFVTVSDNKVVSSNRFPEEMSGIIYATTADGLRGGVKVTVDPLLTDAPAFKELPAISADKAGRTLTLTYSLDTDNPDDRSTVTWYRAASQEDPAPVALLRGPVSRNGKYDITRADKGSYIFADVEPQVYGSMKGKGVRTAYDRRISTRHTATIVPDQKHYETDFSLVPVDNQPALQKGVWKFDAFKPADTSEYNWEAPTDRNAWYFGESDDGAAGQKGLVQAVRGARCFYMPDREKCRSFTASYLLYPAKPAGQGFGSATGQYMDLCFMFDPVGMNGYALRIERTPDHDRAVECRLMKITSGESTPISEPQVTTAFKSPCHVEISAGDGVARARIYSDNDPGAVSVTAPIERGAHSPAIGIQHTGSTGGSATLIKHLEADWK